jgi:hypothetical protein
MALVIVVCPKTLQAAFCFWENTHSQSFKKAPNFLVGPIFCFYCCCILPLYNVVTFHMYYILTLQLALLLLLRRHCYCSTCTHTHTRGKGKECITQSTTTENHIHTHIRGGGEGCYYWEGTTPHYYCYVIKTL